MKALAYIGVDPGLTGALALIDASNPGTARLFSTPVSESYDARRRAMRRDYDIPELLRRVEAIAALYPAGRLSAAVEHVHAMPPRLTTRANDEGELVEVPTHGSQANFSLGYSLGIWLAVLVGAGIRYTLIAPQTWKRLMIGKLSRDQRRQAKRVSLERAREQFPACAPLLERAKDDGRAEALLIAEYGRRMQL